MDDDREAFDFSYALYLARQVDREAAQMIVEAAEAGLIEMDEATESLTEMYGLYITNRRPLCCTNFVVRRRLNF